MIIIHSMNDRTLPRLLDQPLAAALRVMPAVVITGARQTGKSTLVRSHGEDRLYLTLDDIDALDQAGRDEYVAQAADVASRLGVLDPPRTEAELRSVLADFRPELRGTPQAREAVRYLLVKPPLPLAARPPYAVLTSAAIGLMPAWTRRHLRLPWLPVTERTVVRGLGAAAVGTIRWAMTPPGPLGRSRPRSGTGCFTGAARWT